MIAGVGTDVVDVAQFRQQLADPASRFVTATFTDAERAASASRPSGDPVVHLAARFAAKEAFIKAWSGGFYGQTPQFNAVDWRNIEVVSDTVGRPALRLSGAVADAVNSAYPACRIHLSLSHDGPIATAFVILERSGS